MAHSHRTRCTCDVGAPLPRRTLAADRVATAYLARASTTTGRCRRIAGPAAANRRSQPHGHCRCASRCVVSPAPHCYSSHPIATIAPPPPAPRCDCALSLDAAAALTTACLSRRLRAPLPFQPAARLTTPSKPVTTQSAHHHVHHCPPHLV
jgi:hypothetical protein